MASGVAALKVAAAVAIFTMLVMSSQGHGHPKKRPICCSDCASQCNTNCSAIVAANCSAICSTPAECEVCKSEVLHGCQNCCNSNGTSGISCCDNGCIGDCVTCGCNNCDTVVPSHCMYACRINYPACQACQKAVGQQCDTSCNSACEKKCVKKGRRGC